MPKLYKLKVILAGSKSSGKSSFISDFEEEDSPIGVSFESIECYANEGDLYKFVIWDLKNHQRFEFLFPLFCRGACTGLLYFDLNNKQSFIDLNKWIKLLRESNGEIPLILIGTNSDLERNVSEKEIDQLIKDEGIDSVFYISNYNLESRREDIFKRIVQNIDLEYIINDFYIPGELDDYEFKQLENLFERCPICKKKNHGGGELRNIFYNRNNPITLKLRENLLRLVDNLDIISLEFPYQITLGIPCCSCYKKIFEENQPTN